MRWALPHRWRWTTVAQIADVVGGGTPTASDTSNFDKQGIPWITPADLSGYSGTYIERGARGLTKKGYASSGAKLMPANTVLFSSRAPIGYCVIATQPVTTNQGFKSLVLKVDVLPEYVRYYLLGSKRYVEELASGTTFKEISGRRMAEVEIPIAPLDEQHRIVTAIETHFSRLDAAVSMLQRAKANVRRARASVLTAAVEGRLVPTEAALARAEGRSFEPASVLLARILREREAAWRASGARGKYKPPVRPDVAGLAEVPEGWCWASVDALLREPLRNGKSAKPSETDKGIRTLTLTAVTTCKFTDQNTKLTVATADQVDGLWLEPGDLLMQRSNTPQLVGTTALYRGPRNWAVYPDLLIRVRTTPRVSVEFAALALISPLLRGYFRGSAKGIAGSMPKIGQDTIQMAPFPLPPLPEQHRIVAEVDRRLSTLAALDATLDTNLARCARLRQSILQRAFDGRLVPAADSTATPTGAP
ncbi:MAG: restriction endonuclease subunit S [Deltaproteobacteria bacterium]|nr:restriction endonuclease subunit S [Deltaproteobacteria bacterium]